MSSPVLTDLVYPILAGIVLLGLAAVGYLLRMAIAAVRELVGKVDVVSKWVDTTTTELPTIRDRLVSLEKQTAADHTLLAVTVDRWDRHEAWHENRAATQSGGTT